MQCLVIVCMLVKISLTFLTNFVAKITSRFAGKRISFEDISETQESRLNVKCHDRRFCKRPAVLNMHIISDFGLMRLHDVVCESSFSRQKPDRRFRGLL